MTILVTHINTLYHNIAIEKKYILVYHICSYLIYQEKYQRLSASKAEPPYSILNSYLNVYFRAVNFFFFFFKRLLQVTPDLPEVQKIT